MSDPILEVHNISKVYRLGELEKLYNNSFAEALMNTVKRPLRRLLRPKHHDRSQEMFWALKDVSFEVKQGEILGVVGRNGAGKSTLLKILARITAPTRGEAIVKGRMSTLLEVGTGFHSELTGRENIYLNGTILGMKRSDIKRRFDEIVEFSECGAFLDTPVKRYSSGMYLRLAFAVAAYLEPEILLIDEVLAVGDVSFQRKCIAKMDQVSRRDGRTVIFVSHNMAAVQQLCPKCLWLDKGAIRAHAETPVVFDLYLASLDKKETDSCVMFPEDPEKDGQILRLTLMDDKEQPTRSLNCDQKIVVEIDYIVRKRIAGVHGCLSLSREDGTPIMVSISDDVSPNPMANLPEGLNKIRVSIPARTLGHGRYRVAFSTASEESTKGYLINDSGPVSLFSIDDLSTLRGNRRPGFFSTILDWQVSSPEA